MNKKKLAINIINIIHGKLFNNIINIINKIFNNDFNLNNQEFEELISFGIKKIFINNDELLENLIFKFNIFKYKNKIKDIIKNGGIKINNNIIINNKYIFSKKDLLYNKYAFIFKSKKEIFLIIWI
ncbi:hypothetical protein [Candidatus Nardonella dryophthoridicola]|uniref:hypothetical protein n=1 Tax=Candidatus Nardonella dryophthoridicola TaxID=1971485 RepID=UPI003B975B00